MRAGTPTSQIVSTATPMDLDRLQRRMACLSLLKASAERGSQLSRLRLRTSISIQPLQFQRSPLHAAGRRWPPAHDEPPRVASPSMVSG